MNARLHGRIFTLVSSLIFVGVAMLIQPFAFDLYTFGFPLMLVGIAGFILLDHIPAKEPPAEDSDDNV